MFFTWPNITADYPEQKFSKSVDKSRCGVSVEFEPQIHPVHR